MTIRQPLSLLALATLLVSCTYPNHYQNPPEGSPQAVLVGNGVTFTTINETPTAPYRIPGPFRIPAGLTTVKTVAGHLTICDYPVLRFMAEDGQTYRVQRVSTPYMDQVTVRDDAMRVVAEVQRQ